MNPSLCLRSAKVLAAATALSLLVAAGPGGGGPPGGRPQNSQSGGQGNQQCPPGQGQSGGAARQGNSGQSNSGALMGPGGGQGANGQNQNQEPGQQDQGPQTRQRSAGQSLSGTVSGYNLNPGGMPESMMLNTGNSLVQLNFPPEMATSVQSAAAVGSQVTVMARSGGPGGQGGAGNENGSQVQQSDHQVMNLESIKSASGKILTVAGPGSGPNSQVTGTVKQLNYDRRGDVDGAQLDTGTFVHLRPGSDANLSAGEKVSVQGRQRTASNGMKIIEAESINGTSVNGNEPGGQNGPGNNAGAGAGGPPGGGPDGNGAPGQ